MTRSELAAWLHGLDERMEGIFGTDDRDIIREAANALEADDVRGVRSVFESPQNSHSGGTRKAL